MPLERFGQLALHPDHEIVALEEHVEVRRPASVGDLESVFEADLTAEAAQPADGELALVVEPASEEVERKRRRGVRGARRLPEPVAFSSPPASRSSCDRKRRMCPTGMPGTRLSASRRTCVPPIHWREAESGESSRSRSDSCPHARSLPEGVMLVHATGTVRGAAPASIG